MSTIVERGITLRVTRHIEASRGFRLLAAEGESVEGEVLRIGNTNSHYRFSIGARKYVNDWNAHGPAHHCAVGVGHIANKINKLGLLLGLEIARVC